MNYSFMSFSAPKLSFDELLDTAVKYGYDGIEPRIGSGHAHKIEPGVDEDFLADAKSKAAEKGIKLACIATSARYSDPATTAENIALTRSAVDIAASLGVPVIRVFGGPIPEGLKREDSFKSIVGALKEVAPYAEKKGVILCVETHDDWCDPNDVKNIIETVDHPNVMVNWDIMHPCLREGFNIEDSFNILKPYIHHVHVHDGVREGNKSELRPIGEGAVDHKKAVELLKECGYKGFISGEWISWEPYDIHLPREIKTLRSYEGA